jgi:hypothetical protein
MEIVPHLVATPLERFSIPVDPAIDSIDESGY